MVAQPTGGTQAHGARDTARAVASSESDRGWPRRRRERGGDDGELAPSAFVESRRPHAGLANGVLPPQPPAIIYQALSRELRMRADIWSSSTRNGLTFNSPPALVVCVIAVEAGDIDSGRRSALYYTCGQHLIHQLQLQSLSTIFVFSYAWCMVSWISGFINCYIKQ